MQQLDLFEDLNKEYAPALNDILREKINRLEKAQRDLSEAEDRVKELEMRVKELEEQELPHLMDEMQLSSFEFNDGTKVKIAEREHCYVSKDNLAAAYLLLKSIGAINILKPELTVTVLDDTVSETFFKKVSEYLDNFGGELSIEKTYKCHPSTLSAAIKALLAEGAELDMTVFKQDVKRSVKVTNPKIREFLNKR